MKQEPKAIIGVNFSSEFQISNLLAYYLSKKDFENIDKLIVYINDYWGHSVISNEFRTLIEAEFNVEFKNYKFSFSDIESLCKDWRVTFVSVNIPFKKAKLKYSASTLVCVEDGIGAYSSFFSVYKTLSKEKDKLYALVEMLKSAFLFPVNNFFSKSSRFFMFDPRSLHVNQNYICAWKSLANRIYKKNTVINAEKTLLFCSQPLTELGWMSENEYRIMLEKLRVIAGNNSLVLKIKRHPAESIDKFDSSELIEMNGSLEPYLISNKFGMLVGINSTSLLTAKLIFEQDARYVEIDDISFSGVSMLNNKQKKLFRKYCQPLKI